MSEQYREIKPNVDSINGKPYIIYPANLESENGVWVEFNFVKYKRPSRTQNNIYENAAWCALPPPLTINNKYSADWSERELGVLGNAAANLAANPNKQGAANSIKELFGSVPKAALTGLLNSRNKFGIIEGVSAGLGVTKNPFEALLFEKMNFRQFQFDYKFSPRNPKEFEQIQKIIFLFKYAMHPSYTHNKYLDELVKWVDEKSKEWVNSAVNSVSNLISSGTTGNVDSAGINDIDITQNGLMDYPDLVIPTFSNGKNLFKFHPCAITNLDVNFHGEGTPLYMQGKIPASITISITLQEVLYNIKEDIQRGN